MRKNIMTFVSYSRFIFNGLTWAIFLLLYFMFEIFKTVVPILALLFIGAYILRFFLGDPFTPKSVVKPEDKVIFSSNANNREVMTVGEFIKKVAHA